MKTSLLQNLGLSLALTSLGCSETVSPAWIQENSCNMTAVNNHAPDYSIDSEGQAQRGFTHQTVSPSTLAAFQASQTNGYRFCVDPNSRLDSIISGTTFRAYAIAREDIPSYINIQQPSQSNTVTPHTNLAEEVHQLREENHRLKIQVAELTENYKTSLRFNYGLGAISICLGAITVFLTGRRTAFQSIEAYQKMMSSGCEIDLTTLSARYDLWQFKRFGFGDFINKIHQHNSLVAIAKSKSSTESPYNYIAPQH